MRRWWFLLPGLLLVVSLRSTVVMLVTKSYVDLLCIGYSFSKTALLLLFLTLLGLFQACPSPWGKRWNVSFFVGLGTLHVLALIEHTLFVRSVQQPWWSSLILVDNGQFTTTKPAHLHEPKAALAWLTGYQGSDLDNGAGFLPHLPTPLLAFHALVIIAVAIIGFLMVHHHFRTQSGWRSLSLALAVFATAKGSLDGGPLSTESLLSLFFVLGLVSDDRQRLRTPALLFAVAALGSSLLLFGGDPGFGFLKLAGGFALLSAPLFLERYGRAPSLKLLSWSLLILTLGASVPFLQYLCSPQARKPPYPLGMLVYLRQPLEAGDVVFLHHRIPLSVTESSPFQLLRTYRGNRLDTSQVRLNAPTTPEELSGGLGLNLHHYPVTWSTARVRYQFTGPLTTSDLQRWTKSEHVVADQVEESQGQTRLNLTLQGSPTLAVAFDSLPPGNFVLTSLRQFAAASPFSEKNGEESPKDTTNR